MSARHAACLRKPKVRGFTLVEVLVAVAVVAIALAAGLRAAGVLIDNSQRLSDVIVAQWCAENHLANLKLMRQFPGIGESDFSCEQLGRAYSGRMQVAGTQYADLRLVEASVSDDSGRQLVRLPTLLYRP
ncbi:MAG: type II secretion system minor pseudopilin GspI [Rubrivivax sp.]